MCVEKIMEKINLVSVRVTCCQEESPVSTPLSNRHNAIAKRHRVVTELQRNEVSAFLWREFAALCILPFYYVKPRAGCEILRFRQWLQQPNFRSIEKKNHRLLTSLILWFLYVMILREVSWLDRLSYIAEATTNQHAPGLNKKFAGQCSKSTRTFDFLRWRTTGWERNQIPVSDVIVTETNTA
jgi:hypothetical protein